MPIEPQQSLRTLGEYHHRTENYVSEQAIQHHLHRLARRQQNNLPQQLSVTGVLFISGILSNLTHSRNTPASLTLDMPHGQGRALAQGRGEGCGQMISAIQAVAPYNAGGGQPPARLQGILPQGDGAMATDIMKPLSLFPALSDYPIMKNIAEVLYAIAKAGGDMLNLVDPLRFPAADARIPPTVITTTEPATDDVVRTKIDISCTEQRRELSASEVLAKIADSLEHPITEMAREVQVVMNYITHGVCPPAQQVEKVLNIAAEADDVMSGMLNFIPDFAPTLLAQKVLSPVIRMCAEELEGKAISELEIENFNDQMLSLSKSMLNLYPKGANGQPMLAESDIPAGLSVKKGELYATINDEIWLLSREGEHVYASRNGVKQTVNYDKEQLIWTFDDNASVLHYDEQQDPFFTQCPHRVRRGAGLGTLCHVVLGDELSASDHNNPSSTSDGAIRRQEQAAVDAASVVSHQALVNRLDIGLLATSPRVDKMHFTDDWVLYRVQPAENPRAHFYHAIEIDGKLVPVRAKNIYHHHLNCEIYDLHANRIGYPVEFYQGRWQVEPPTSRYAAESLREAMAPELFVKGITSRDLSIAGKNGLKWDTHGHTYLKINNRFVKIEKEDTNFFIQTEGADRYYLSYTDEQFHFYKMTRLDGLYTLNPEQLKMDRQLLSARGLTVKSRQELNEEWKILALNIRSSDFRDSGTVGSKIDVLFRFKYLNNEEFGYIEPPELRWIENIKFKEDEALWQFKTNMFRHNRNSRTFFPWRHRYVEAYHYAKARDKKMFHGMTRFYKHDMKPVGPDDLPFAATMEKKINAVKQFLLNNGGVIEVIITDLPQLRFSEVPTHKERLINFDIGFGDQSLVQFSQGILINKEQEATIFVTTGDGIKLAQGTVNREAPEYVVRPRVLKHRS